MPMERYQFSVTSYLFVFVKFSPFILGVETGRNGQKQADTDVFRHVALHSTSIRNNKIQKSYTTEGTRMLK